MTTEEVTLLKERVALLPKVTLGRGRHAIVDPPAGECCIMEVASWLRGAPKPTDRDDTVCPVIGSFARAWNDVLGPDTRSGVLLPFATRLIGTNTSPADSERRAFMLLDWLVRVNAPTWLRLAGLTAEADALVACAPVRGEESLRSTLSALSAAGDAAEDAAGDAAEDAARAAAGATAWTAARDAAWAAARAAAGAKTTNPPEHQPMNDTQNRLKNVTIHYSAIQLTKDSVFDVMRLLGEVYPVTSVLWDTNCLSCGNLYIFETEWLLVDSSLECRVVSDKWARANFSPKQSACLPRD